MGSVGRYAKATAKPGKGDELAAIMLEVAAALEDVSGCELYVVNREPGAPDVVWVSELWASQEQLDKALETDGAGEQIPRVMELVDSFERIDLEPLGGVGPMLSGTGFTRVNLDEVEDMAPRFGFGELGEARFARGALETSRTGLSLHRVRPGCRQAFGHRHQHAEEVYVVLSGSGRVAIDDQTHEVSKLDAIRIAPESTRALEAGPEGLEVLVFGPHHAGDGDLEPGFWPDEEPQSVHAD
jgi:quinol monooxygenase YgiN/quercetin dioxygenase-like cupin family protein